MLFLSGGLILANGKTLIIFYGGIMDKITNKGLRALTTSKERQELRAFGKPPVKWILRYHKGSERTGKPFGIDCRLWDIISPRVPGYVYNADSGPVTRSIEGLAEIGAKLGDTRIRGKIGLRTLKDRG